MRQTVRLGRVAGIPVGAHWSVLVVMVLLAQGLAIVLLPAAAPGHPAWLYWVVALGTTVLFLASLMAHEVAHAVVARHYRLRVEQVTLWLLGGVAELGGQPSTPRADLRVAAVGPLTSLAAGALCYAAAVVSAGWLPSVLVAALSWLAWINVLLALFNLLPGAPLDGGRVLRALLWRHWQDRTRAEVAAARAGRGLGGALVALAIVQVLVVGNMSGLWLALLGWFLIQAATIEQRTAELTGRFGQLPVRIAMDPRPPVAHLDQSVQDFLDTVVQQSRQRSFIAVDAIGRPGGIVHLARLAGVAPAMRTSTAVADVIAPVGMTLEADRPLSEVAATLPPVGTEPLPVVEHGVLVGTLTPADLARAIDLATLRVLDAQQRTAQSL